MNAYGCFVESHEHFEGHKITKRLISGEIFLKRDSTVKCFDSSIYYFLLILRKLRYVFSKEYARSCVCKASNQHCVQSCRCNRCVALSLGFAKD